MEKVKHLIWSSDVDYEDWRDDMESEYPDLTDEERESLAYEINNEYLDDERCNLNIPLSRPILVMNLTGLEYRAGAIMLGTQYLGVRQKKRQSQSGIVKLIKPEIDEVIA